MDKINVDGLWWHGTRQDRVTVDTDKAYIMITMEFKRVPNGQEVESFLLSVNDRETDNVACVRISAETFCTMFEKLVAQLEH